MRSLIGCSPIALILILTGFRMATPVGNAIDFHAWAGVPPMGWNSWDCFGPTVTEAEVRSNADYMASHLKNVGWQYIVVDIRWYVANDKSHGYNEENPAFNLDIYGRFQPSTERFPSAADGKGFFTLATYIHSKGLKFGIHLMRGIPVEAVRRKTPIPGSSATAADVYSPELQCRWLHDMYTVDASKPGAQEYYNSLFSLYASWGVDYVKIDDLSIPYHAKEIEMIRKAIDACGREIVLSTSPGETPIEYADHIVKNANLFRIVGDFWDNWPQVKQHFDVCDRWSPYVGNGHWPDADMLPLGKIGIRAERGDNRMCQLTPDEQQTVMTLFSIFRSPLMFGGDLTQSDSLTLSLISNPEVLYVNQHSTHNRQLSRENGVVVWTANDPANGDILLALFNTQDQPLVDETKAAWKSAIMTKASEHSLAEVRIPVKGGTKLFLVASQRDLGYTRYDADWINPVISGPAGTKSLSELPVKHYGSGPVPAINKSIGGNALSVGSEKFARGIGTYANSILEFDIPEGYDFFSAKAGIDQSAYKPGLFGVEVMFLAFTQNPTAAMPANSTPVTVSFDQLGIQGSVQIRDLWAKKDLGKFEHTFTKPIARHASGLYRISRR